MANKKNVEDPSTLLRTNSNSGIRIAVGMSGGVDSSVSAYLLKKQGYDVVGLFMKLWHQPRLNEKGRVETGDPCGTGQNACCDEKALIDARKVAKKIGIPLYVVDARREFKSAVTDYFVDEYKNVRTPNPCVVCNKKIKFGWMLEFAKKIGCEKLATGHYARIISGMDGRLSRWQVADSNPSVISTEPKASGEIFSRDLSALGKPRSRDDKGKSIFRLLKGVDESKDQSYFLYQLNQEQLSKIVFPVGEMTKAEVRKIAKEAGLPVHEKKESQEICFVEDDYRDFLRRNLGQDAFKPGEIVDAKCNVIGRHDGLINYTIGQRKGIEQISNFEFLISNQIPKPNIQKQNRQPLYVTGFNIENNQLIVGGDKELYKSEFEVENIYWTSRKWKVEGRKVERLKVKIRYKAEGIPCKITMIRDSRYKIQLAKPARALTPGQSAVFYSGDEVIGGGIIK